MQSINRSNLSFAAFILFLVFGGTDVYAQAQPFDFTLSQEIQGGASSWGLLANDFNKDGNTDLLVGYYPVGFNLLTGSGSGSFTYSYGAPGGSVDFAFGDFNEDGILDFVGAGPEPGTVFLGSSGGTFVGTSLPFDNTFPPRFGLTYVASGDINKDGHLDIITTGSTDRRVGVFFGDGAGNFSLHSVLSDFATTGSPFFGLGQIGVNDFNEDGNLDIFVHSVAGGQIFVFFSDGAGGFSIPIIFDVGSLQGIDTVDINNDGHADIIRTGDSIQVFLGDGAGNFLEKISSVGVYGGLSAAIADFDGDGNLDLAMPNKLPGLFPRKITIAKGNGDGTFTFVKNIDVDGEPSSAVAGDFNNDGFPDFAITNTSTFKTSIFLNHPNQAPILDPIGNKTVDEGETLSFAVQATDPDGDALTYSASNLPPGATFSPATATFSWTPSFNQSGNYTDIEFTVMDNGNPMKLATELITVTVGDVNRPPVFTPVGSQEVLENHPLTFSVTASDPDGDAVVFSATNLPLGAVFNSGTATFSWTPNNAQSGVYVVTFIALDNGFPVASSTLEVPITVGDVPTPVEQANNIIAVVIADNFPTNVENSYLANLRKVAGFIESGKIGQAINQLNAFIQKVQTDVSHGVLTQTKGNELIALANALLGDLQ